MARKKRQKTPLTPQEKRQKTLRNSIDSVFLNCGFVKFKTDGWEFSIGGRARNEIDSIFVSDNLIVIVEDTIDPGHDHIRTKYETYQKILENWSTFLDLLSSKFVEFDSGKFDTRRWKPFFLYFCDETIDFTSIDPKTYEPIKFVHKNSLSYFVRMSKLLKRSFKYELYRFLEIKTADIGDIRAPGTNEPQIPIVYPTEVTGLRTEVSLVSFMISADYLIRNGYVLRKDNWEESAGLYQRLLIPGKLKDIRQFVCKEKRTFFNNIIVSLPPSAKLRNKDGNTISSNDLSNFENCTLHLPDEHNSICIIDGQHRVYAYYESDPSDAQETTIANLRKRMHLLVTGILFPTDWDERKRRAFESSLFLEINENSKTVDKDITIHIEAQKEPYARNSIAREILIKMNEQGVFAHRFQISLLEEDKIKTSTIIQYALGRLVGANDDKLGFYHEWRKTEDGINAPLELSSENDSDGQLLTKYIHYCVSSLNQYFSAIKNVYSEEWGRVDAKITKVFAINALIIALHKSLKSYGVKPFDFYVSKFQNAERIDFQNPGFAGSQYAKFANFIVETVFTENDQ